MSHFYEGERSMAGSANDLGARMREIIESLHRAKLTLQQREGQIAEYWRLVKEKRAVLEIRSKQPETAKFEQLDLSNEWKELIMKFWERDDLLISDLLGETVAAVKSSKSSSMAQRALLLIFHSPKVHRLGTLLQPTNVLPERQAATAMVDAARLPRGSVDTVSAALRIATSALGGLDVSQFLKALDAAPDRETDEASAQRAKRGLKKLGTPRKVGRPRKTVAR
jgi:hypothetical protein